VHNILLHIREVKHPPTNKFTDLPPPLAPPSSRNNKTRLFHHLQQHGFEKPSVRSVLLQVLTDKGKILLKDMLAYGIQGKTDQEEKTMFAEMLTNSGSLKIQFYYHVKSLPVSRVLSILVQALSLC
jgi:hypothetical protein